MRGVDDAWADDRDHGGMRGPAKRPTQGKRRAPTMIRWVKAVGKWRATAPNGQKAAAQLVFVAAEMIWDDKGGELKNNTADVCEAVGIPRASYYRWMNVLKAAGFLDHKTTGKYINLIATFPPGADDGMQSATGHSATRAVEIDEAYVGEESALSSGKKKPWYEDSEERSKREREEERARVVRVEEHFGMPYEELRKQMKELPALKFASSRSAASSEPRNAESTSETTCLSAMDSESATETELSPEETYLSTSETELSLRDNPYSSYEVRNEEKM